MRKTDGSWEVFTAFCVAGALITLVPAVRDWLRPTPGEWAVLAAVGVTSVVGQLLMTHSLRYVPAAAGGVIIQLTPVTSLAIGWALLSERIGALALGGAALTLAGVSLGTYLAAAAANPTPPPTDRVELAGFAGRSSSRSRPGPVQAPD